MFWDHHTYYHQRSGERQEKRTKTPYSLHIHLITMRLSIWANRRVANWFKCLFSGIGCATSSCTAPCRAQVHDLTHQVESLAFGQLLVIQKRGFRRNPVVQKKNMFLLGVICACELVCGSDSLVWPQWFCCFHTSDCHTRCLHCHGWACLLRRTFNVHTSFYLVCRTRMSSL